MRRWDETMRRSRTVTIVYGLRLASRACAMEAEAGGVTTRVPRLAAVMWSGPNTDHGIASRARSRQRDHGLRVIPREYEADPDRPPLE
jgi:hypothetical protein